MKKTYTILSIILIILAIFTINTTSYADTDEITNYVVTVEPRMNDGSLDITYEITWKVLDSITQGPLEWVQIGTPNESFDSEKALTSNIKDIKKYNGAFVKITFDRPYNSNEEITFKYSIHQRRMYKTSWGNCKYEFTPAWFTDIRIDNLTIKWNKDQVKKSNKNKQEDNYLIWNKKNLSKGAKVTANITYSKKAFGSLSTDTQASNHYPGPAFLYVFFMLLALIVRAVRMSSGGDYYGHRGFYGGGYYGGYRGGYRGGCVHSSCACAHSSCASSCACACAGSGRAGCSLKDFYKTNITTKKIQKAMKKA